MLACYITAPIVTTMTSSEKVMNISYRVPLVWQGVQFSCIE